MCLLAGVRSYVRAAISRAAADSQDGRPVEEPNISQWRRTVCGDLTSAFQAYDGPESGLPPVSDRSVVIEGIHRAKFKDPPSGFKILTDEDIDQIRRDPQRRPSCPVRSRVSVARAPAL